MLTLTFLGVGSAFARRNEQSNALLEAWRQGLDSQQAPDDNLLIDFGATGPRAYDRLAGEPGFEYLNRDGNPCYTAIRRIFITHLHSDHVGGLEELAWCSMKSRGGPDGPGPRPELIVADALLPRLWEGTLRGGLSAMEGRELNLGDFFDVRLLPPPSTFDRAFRLLDRYTCRPIPTDHIRVARRHDWPSFGLVLEDAATGATAVYSGDTRFDPEGLGPWLRRSALTFHEVQLEPEEPRVHAQLAELDTLPADVKKRMILFHYSDAWDDPRHAWVNEVFAGFAQPRRRYVVFA